MSAQGAAFRKWATHGHNPSLPLRWPRLKRGLRIAGWALLGAIILTVPVQLLYPTNRVLPFMKIGGLTVGGQDKETLLTTLGDYAQNGETKIVTPSKQWQTKWQDIGLTIDREASAEVVLDYALWERLVPLSGFIKAAQSQQLPLIAIVDNDRLNAFAKQLVAEDKLAARSASVAVVEGRVVVDPAKSGYEFDPSDVKMQIQRLAIAQGSVVRLVPENIPAERSAAEVQGIRRQAEAILAHKLTLVIGDKTFTPTPTEVGNWLNFTEDAQTKELKIAFNTESVKKHLETINKEVGVEPGTSTITLLDNIEVGRTPAQGGRSVATDASVAAITTALQASQPEPRLELSLAVVPPKVEYVRTFSQTSEGLLAIIRDWEASAPGDYGVIVRELGGERRYAEWQPDKKYVTASTFKMFVAYALLTKIAQGLINFGQITDIGWTVDACLTEMIVNSTNPCSVSFLNLMGWAETQRMVTEAGFVSTLIDNGCCQEKHSTVRDETNFMLRLNAGTLLDPGGTERLLSMFKRQVWRGGIPTGVPKGVVVADKVGFYAGYIHDVGIIYAPKGTYILGIMSYGGNNPSMADLSRRVYNFFQN